MSVSTVRYKDDVEVQSFVFLFAFSCDSTDANSSRCSIG